MNENVERAAPPADPVLPPPSHRHPMSGEPIWDEAAARACYEKARADLVAQPAASAEPVRFNWNEHLQANNALQYQHDFNLFKVVDSYVVKHLTANAPVAAPVAAQKADDARDAERWREWKRGNAITVRTAKSILYFSPRLEPDFPECMDAAIDAAMQRTTTREEAP